jgi:tRNA (guanine37-N1)-methyltransferase
MRVDVLTLFPEMLSGFLEQSMMKRAVSQEAVSFNIVNPRDFSADVHHTTDDRPYGGGPGMVMKPEPLFAAVESVKTPESRVIYLSPQGSPFHQKTAERLRDETHLIFICGHYEGIDERIIEALATMCSPTAHWPQRS